MKSRHPVLVFTACVVGTILVAASAFFFKAPVASESADPRIGALPQLSPGRGDSAAARLSREKIGKTRVSLDRITAASVQEISDLLAGLSSRERALLAQQLARLPVGAVSTAKVAVFFKAWSQLDPEAALTAALSFKQTWAKDAGLQAVFEGVSTGSAQHLVASLDALPENLVGNSLRRGLLSRGVVKWSQADPSGAAGFLNSAGSKGLSPSTWQQVAQNWAALDPEAALQWTTKQQDSNNARVAVQGLLDGWWLKDSSAAAAFAQGHTDTISGQQGASIVASRMASTDPETAAAWAARLQNSNARQMSELTAGVAWASQDPEAAGKWATELPEEDRASAVSAVAGTWAQTDPQGAAEWINSLAGTVKDDAITAFSSAVVSIDPGTALGWSLTIANPDLRDQVAQRIVVEWMLRQPDEAKAWIRNSGLSEPDKSRLLTLPSQ